MLENILVADDLTRLPGKLTELETSQIMAERNLAIGELLQDANETGKMFRTEGALADLVHIFDRDHTTRKYDRACALLEKTAGEYDNLYMIFNAASVPFDAVTPITIAFKKAGMHPLMTLKQRDHTISIPLTPVEDWGHPESYGFYIGEYWYRINRDRERKKDAYGYERANVARQMGHQLGVDLIHRKTEAAGIYMSSPVAKKLFFITALLYPRAKNPFPSIILGQ